MDVPLTITAITATIGVILDQTTTRLGLLLGYVETNPLVINLLTFGTWAYFDFALLILIYGTTLLGYRHLPKPYKYTLLTFPIVFGLLRGYAGFKNLALIF